MSANLRQAVTYVVYTPIRLPTVRSAVTYVIYGDRAFPKGVTGQQALFDLIKELTDVVLVPGDMTIGPPEPVAINDCNTRIKVSSKKIGVRGDMYFYYNRAEMRRIPIPANFVPSATDLHQLVPDLQLATGMLVSEDDFVNAPVTAGKVKIEAASSSYFFLPGSFLQW